MKNIILYLRISPIRVKLAVGFMVVMLFFAVAGRFLANDVPIYVTHHKWTGFPVLEKSSYLSFKQDYANPKVQFQIKTPIPYAATSIDYTNGLVGPFNWKYGNRHLLGTDSYNRDVMAGLIYGSRVALLVGILSNLIALLIGIFLGSLSGYFGNNGVLIGRNYLLSFIFLEIILLYLILSNSFIEFYIPSFGFRMAIFLVFTYLLAYKLFRQRGKLVRVPIDIIITKLLEVFQSIPGLMLLLGISAVVGTMSLLKLTFLVALLRWPAITRLVRAEVMKLKQNSFIETAKSLGIGDFRVIYRHIFPNIFNQLMVAFAFGVASSILMEAALSFLGLGLPPDQITWGLLLSQARTNPAAWWLALFPGLMISLIILSCYVIGNYLWGSSSTKLKTGESII